MLNRSTLMILVLVVVFALCGLGESVDPLYTDNNTASNTSSGRLNETEWVLTSLNGNSPVENSTITLAFTYENDISGCTGCNNYGGRYTINGNDFNIFVQGRTDFDCDVPESIMQQEATYLKLLASAAAYLVMDDRLEIDNAAGEMILTFMIKEEPSIDPNLNETEWVLTSLNGNSPVENSTITLAFTYENDISGCTGCNNYGGRYTINGNDFNIFVQGRTDFDCDVPESIMQQEATYLKLLASAAAYLVMDDRLEIDNAAGEMILTFMIKEEPSIDPNLNETEWVLISLNGKSLVEESRITLSFAERITGFAGCNRYGGEYTMADNGTLTIPEIMITAQLCLMPKGVMPQEAAYIKALSDAAAYLVMDDRLEIDNAAAETIIIFTLKEELLMDPSALEGIEWQLISWNGRSPHKDSNITIAFAAGEISGHAGYRDYAGTYEASGDDIRFTSIGMKEPTSLKPEALRFQESGYTTNLSLATNYRLSEGELEIFTAPGGVLIYAPVSEEKTSGFEAVFAVVGFITVTYFLRKRK